MNYSMVEPSTERCECEKPTTVRDQTKRILDLSNEILIIVEYLRNDIFPYDPKGVEDNVTSAETIQETLGAIELQLNKVRGTLSVIREHIG